MLVLSRHRDEAIWIGEIKVIVVEIRGDKVRLGIEAPLNVPVHRSEVRDAMLKNDGKVTPNAIGRKHAATSLGQRWGCSPQKVYERIETSAEDKAEFEEELKRLRAEAAMKEQP